MQRCLIALVASITLALGAGVGVASANGTLVPPAPVAPTQVNVSDQEQVQVAPVAPQVNVQNVNVLTLDEVEQGDANNANTGQASQQENTASGGSSGSQANDSDQSQVQVVPVAPQVNVQNVNVLTLDEVEQGDANNANTGQASQQENTASGGSRGIPAPATRCGSCRSPSNGRQRNDSDQSQVQIVPVAPQLNVQNANVLTFDEVEQGDANNANTGQASQQKNTARSASCRSSCGSPAPCGCTYAPTPRSKPCGCKQAHHAHHRHHAPKECGCGTWGGAQVNRSGQRQIQIVPIAPQLNVQNVNVLTFGDVEQGDANNANTGQASQQQNTPRGSRKTGPPPVRV